MKKLLSKVFVFFIGFLVILILLEIALRIVGMAYQTKDSHINCNSDSKKTKCTILCLGDSHTYGFGVEQQFSYPSRLQALFDKDSHFTVTVINHGKVTQNTTHVLNSLQKSIDDIKPDIIILLSGGANHWNYYGYNSTISYPSLSGFFNKLLYNIKVYKLLVLFSKNMSIKLFFSDRDEQRQEELKKNQEKLNHYLDKVKSEPNNPENYFYIGLYYSKIQKIDEAIKWLDRGIDADPQYGNNFLLINYCLSNNSYDLLTVINWFKKELKKYPNNPFLYKLISENYYKIGEKDTALYWASEASNIQGNVMKMYFSDVNRTEKNFLEKRAIAIDPRFLNVSSTALGVTQGFIGFGNQINNQEIITENENHVLSWIKADIEKIFQTCVKNNIKLVLQSYAIKPEINFWTNTTRTVNDVLKEVANENGIPFLDNEMIFGKLENNGRDFFNQSKNDGHPNIQGYEMMAKNLYDYIVTNKFLELASDIRD